VRARKRQLTAAAETPASELLCSAVELAPILGIKARQIDLLATEGVLRFVKGKAGRRFYLGETVQSYVHHVRKSARGTDDSEYDNERTVRMRALAQIETMRARQLAGELLERSQVMLAISQAVAATKGHVLAIPNRTMHQLVGRTTPLETREIVRSACTLALRDLSRLDVDSFSKMSKNGQTADDYVSRKRRKIRRERARRVS
jgi:hypothetical protein